MELIFPHYTTGKGIYGKAKTVDPKQYVELAKEMADWFDAANGNFNGNFKSGYAIAHQQVCEDGIAAFVVAKELCTEVPDNKRLTSENYYFPARVVFNAEILENTATIEREMPVREIIDDPLKPNEKSIHIKMGVKTVSNVIQVEEACMSFPHRTEKRVDRFYRVKVRYQYLKHGLLGWRVENVEEWVSGLKAHIFQHELDHFAGKNIYHSNEDER